MHVITVKGPIPPEKLGITATHEHVLIDLTKIAELNGLLNDEGLAIEELKAFKNAGGRTVVDQTNHGLCRSPEALKRVSEATGLNIVMGCGWYMQSFFNGGGWYRQPSYDIDRMSTNDLAKEIVCDLTIGVNSTGIRAGIIGEIGTTSGYVRAGEERVLRAVARAHKETGAAISTHSPGSEVGLEQLDILEEEGADLQHVIIGHCDTYLNLDYHEAIINRGALVQYDQWGKENLFVYLDKQRLDCLAELLSRGYESQIVLSTDRCMRSDLHAYGGHGYDHVLVNILPGLKKRGVSEEQIYIMTVENPARVLPF